LIFGAIKSALAYNEEVILHLNKASYLSGDVIWLKAYLRNSENKSDNFSVIVYMEMVDGNDNILTRLKLKCVRGTAYGNIMLPNELPTGKYSIRSYTLQMKSSNWEFGAIEFPVINFSDYKERIEGASPEAAHTLVGESKMSKNAGAKLKISTNQLTYSQRDRINLTIGFDSKKSQQVKGNVSVSVARYYGESAPVSRPSSQDLESQKGSSIKEMTLYPLHNQSIPEQSFLSVAGVNPEGISISNELAEALPKIEERRKLAQDLERIFGKSESFGFDRQGNLPHNKAYFPNRYASLPSLEDFIIEVMVEVKIKTRTDTKVLRILNTENKNRVFLFKKNPLILVDGFIQTDIEGLLKMEPAKISKIEVTWSDSMLKLSSIFNLADNGIISIYTTDNSGSKMRGASFNIHEGFSQVNAFVSPRYDGGEEDENAPDFRDPLYWAPDVSVEGKTKLSFYASDEFGEFLITVVGVTENGELLEAEQVIRVTK
jgi:hypothetical protein